MPKTKLGRRFTAAQKAKILAAAKKEGLTGEHVAKQFGVSKLSFYRWRGPVRSDALRRRGKRGPGRPRGSGRVKADTASIRREVQAQVRKLLPQLIREEVAAALSRG